MPQTPSMNNHNQHLKKEERHLPDELRKYFWDCDFDKLTLEKYPKFITERILNYGDWNSVKWLLTLINLDFIRQLIESSREFNEKTRNFWNVLLNE
jgi:hypothetical protein